MKLGQGNAFRGVCDSVHGGGCLLQCMLGCQTPPTPPGADTSQEQIPPSQEADASIWSILLECILVDNYCASCEAQIKIEIHTSD